MGASASSSPQGLSSEQLRAVFDQFASADGALSLAAFGNMLRALAVDVQGDSELRRIFGELDTDRSGGITHAEWAAWWEQNVAAEPVQLLLGQEEFEAILKEEPKDKLVCLEVGMTFCRPCKGFEKTYKARVLWL